MRSSAIARVAYDEITMRQGILTPAEKTKKNRRNYIENLPDNLWAWLERTPKTAFSWCERKWKKRKETALIMSHQGTFYSSTIAELPLRKTPRDILISTPRTIKINALKGCP